MSVRGKRRSKGEPAAAAAAAAEEPEQSASDFWAESEKQLAHHIENGSVTLNEIINMANDRADIERKYAKDLAKFSKKWTDRLAKSPEFKGATINMCWQTLCNVAEETSAVHTQIADQVTGLVAGKFTTFKKEHYSKSFGKIVESKNFTKGFEAARKPWAKADADAQKKYKALMAKKNELYETQLHLKLARHLDADDSVTGVPKILKKIEKLTKDLDKCTHEHEKQLDVLKAKADEFMRAVTMQFDGIKGAERKRVEFMKAAILEELSVLNVTNHASYPKIFTDAAGSINASNSDVDVVKLTEFIGIEKTAPPETKFDPWVQPAEITEHKEGSVFPLPKEKMPIGQFSKSGEKAMSISHKRFFVLRGTELMYFSSYSEGALNGHKGTVDMATVSGVSLDGKSIHVSTPKREWKMSGHTTKEAENWAKMLAAKAKVELGHGDPHKGGGVAVAAAGGAAGAGAGAASAEAADTAGTGAGTAAASSSSGPSEAVVVGSSAGGAAAAGGATAGAVAASSGTGAAGGGEAAATAVAAEPAPTTETPAKSSEAASDATEAEDGKDGEEKKDEESEESEKKEEESEEKEEEESEGSEEKDEESEESKKKEEKSEEKKDEESEDTKKESEKEEASAESATPDAPTEE